MKNFRKYGLFWGRLSNRVKAQVGALLAFLVVIGLFLPFSLLILAQGVERLETTQVLQALDRAREAINKETDHLDALLVDWAFWDDTYEYVENQNPDYVVNNLNDKTFNTSGFDFLGLVNMDGQPVYYFGFNQDKGHREALPFSFEKLLEENPEIFRLSSSDQRWGGLMVIGNQPLMVVARPVLTSTLDGPAKGVMIVGRYMGETTLNELSEFTHSIIMVLPGGINNPSLDFLSEKNTLSLSGGNFMRPVDQHQVSGYTFLKDVSGNPSLVLGVTMPREIYAQGRYNEHIFTAVFLGIGLVFLIFAYFTLYQYLCIRDKGRDGLNRYRAVIQQADESILLLGKNHQVLDANPASKKLLGVEENEIPGITLDDLVKDITTPGQTNHIHPEAGNSLAERSYLLRNDDRIDVEVSASHIILSEEKVLLLVMRDISDRKRVENALRESEERYELAAQGANDGLWDWDLITNKIYFSPRWVSMLGYVPNEILDSPDEWLRRTHPDDLVALNKALSNHLKGHTDHFECEYRIQQKGGRYVWMLSTGKAIWNIEGYAYRMAGSQTDMSHRKQIEEQLSHDALHDPLTRLPNRTLFIERLTRAYERNKRQTWYPFAVLFLDFDRFKRINDNYGHPVGDRFLVEASGRLQGGLRSLDTLARLSGDEFAVLLENISNREEAFQITSRIQETLQSPFNIVEGQDLTMTASIGIVFPQHAYKSCNEILRDAEIAMYSAKEEGRAKVVVFQPEMYTRASERLVIENELRQAIDRQEFCVYYQPICTLEERKIIGFEALVRWNHPVGGLTLPAHFIPVAEETGLIIPIGRWVMRQACLQVGRWQRRFPQIPQLSINVNLSTRQFAQANLLEDVKSMLVETGFSPHGLWLEITESALIEDTKATLVIINGLKSIGVRVGIDDFGTGYSSLSYLRQLPVDVIKIDRSFIHGIEENENNKKIAETIIHLAHKLGYMEIAEGLETLEQVKHLIKMGCAYGQGYYFCKPSPPETIEALLKSDSYLRTPKNYSLVK